MPRDQQGPLAGGPFLIDSEWIDRERDALGRRREAANARLRQGPFGDEENTVSGRFEDERRLDLRDQQIGPVDLRDDEEVLGSDGEGWIGAAHLRTGLPAPDLNAERIADEVFGRA